MTQPEKHLEEMKQSILNVLVNLREKQGSDYGMMKFAISNKTGIPGDVLTVLLKQLKYAGKVELITIWSEETYAPDGSGYRLTNSEL